MAKKAAGGAKKAATKKAATKKAATKKSAKAGAKKSAKAGAKKKASAGPKLSDKQKDLLGKVSAAGESGFVPDKADGAAARGLRLKKLLKGKKVDDKVHYLLTNAGKKALGASTSTTPA